MDEYVLRIYLVITLNSLINGKYDINIINLTVTV